MNIEDCAYQHSTVEVSDIDDSMNKAALNTEANGYLWT